MILARCIEKHRDINNKIQGYTLQDLYGNTLYFEPVKLKQAIISKQIMVSNLTLTRDYRLVEKQDETFKKYKKQPVKQEPTEEEVENRLDKVEEVIRKTLDKYLPDYDNKSREWFPMSGDKSYIEHNGATYNICLDGILTNGKETNFDIFIEYEIRKDYSEALRIATVRINKNYTGTEVNPTVDSEELQVKLKTTKITEDIIQRIIWAYLANIKEGIYEGAFKTKYTINL